MENGTNDLRHHVHRPPATRPFICLRLLTIDGLHEDAIGAVFARQAPARPQARVQARPALMQAPVD